MSISPCYSPPALFQIIAGPTAAHCAKLYALYNPSVANQPFRLPKEKVSFLLALNNDPLGWISFIVTAVRCEQGSYRFSLAGNDQWLSLSFDQACYFTASYRGQAAYSPQHRPGQGILTRISS